MAIDSKAKGRTAENKAKDILKQETGLSWERTPLSGALHEKHKLKGDLYVPDTKIIYCVEVKHYKDDHISTKLLTSKNPQFMIWWEQTTREAEQMDKEPLLLFKHNRSKWFAAFYGPPDVACKVMDKTKFITVESPDRLTIFICLLTDFCKHAEWLA